MNDDEFLESLKTDEDRFSEFTAGAEHFIRLKKQSGILNDPPSESTKEAAPRKASAAKRFMDGVISGSPLEHMAKGMRRAVKGPNRAAGAGQATMAAASGTGLYTLGKKQGKNEAKKKTAADIETLQHVQNKLAEDLTEKRAGLADKLKSIGPLSLTLMGAGAGIGGLGTYLGSKPRPELGGKSRAEEELEAKVLANRSLPEEGLLHKMRNRTTELEHGFSQAFRDHPGKASLLGAGAGALAGHGLARVLGGLRGAK